MSDDGDRDSGPFCPHWGEIGGDCEECWAENERTVELRAQLASATARAEAAEAKVRDVETLDATRYIVTLGWGFDNETRTVSLWGRGCPMDAFAAETAHEARAAAAQWVRENSPPQKKPTDDGSDK